MKIQKVVDLFCSVLNSKGEFNRSYIPRLKVEEMDKVKELENLEEQELEVIKNKKPKI